MYLAQRKNIFIYGGILFLNLVGLFLITTEVKADLVCGDATAVKVTQVGGECILPGTKSCGLWGSCENSSRSRSCSTPCSLCTSLAILCSDGTYYTSPGNCPPVVESETESCNPPKCKVGAICDYCNCYDGYKRFSLVNNSCQCTGSCGTYICGDSQDPTPCTRWTNTCPSRSATGTLNNGVCSGGSITSSHTLPSRRICSTSQNPTPCTRWTNTCPSRSATGTFNNNVCSGGTITSAHTLPQQKNCPQQATSTTLNAPVFKTTPSCDVLAKLTYTSPYTERTDDIILEIKESNNPTSTASTFITTTIYTKGSTQGVYNHQLKPTDYNKNIDFTVSTSTPTLRSSGYPSSRTAITPTYPHTNANFTIQDLNSQPITPTNLPQLNQQLKLVHTNPTKRTQNLIYKWTFTPTQPTFHNGTSSTSRQPIVSFNTGGTHTIQLTINDTNINTDNTQNACNTSKSVYIPVPPTQTQFNTPDIKTTNSNITLGLTRQCGGVVPISYSSNNNGNRVDRLTITDTANKTIYSTYYRDTQAGYHIFKIPTSRLTPSTQYTATITSERGTGQNPLKTTDPTISTPDTLTFTTPPDLTTPSANFTYTTERNLIYLTSTSQGSHLWSIPTGCQFTQATTHTHTNPVVECFTQGTHLISLTASTTNFSLSCTKGYNIPITPQGTDTRIEQVVPTY